MFHLDMTFEDTRIIANSKDGESYEVHLCDLFTGSKVTMELDAVRLAKVVAMNLNAEAFEAFGEDLQPLLGLLPEGLLLMP
jgi:hypothetical protein